MAVLAARRGTTTDKFHQLGLAIQERSDVPALEDCGAVLWCSIEQECPVGTTSCASVESKRPLTVRAGRVRSFDSLAATTQRVSN